MVRDVLSIRTSKLAEYLPADRSLVTSSTASTIASDDNNIETVDQGLTVTHHDNSVTTPKSHSPRRNRPCP